MISNIEFIDISNLEEVTISDADGAVTSSTSTSSSSPISAASDSESITTIITTKMDTDLPSGGSNSEQMTALERSAANSPSKIRKTKASIIKEFRTIIRDPEKLDEAANYLFSSLVDDAIFGIFIETHRLNKSSSLTALEGVPEDEESHQLVDMPNFDVFGVSTSTSKFDCACPNCDRLVSASRFAPHLEKCMGMGRISQRVASRRLASKEAAAANTNAAASSSTSSSSSYMQSNTASDDEDDADWTDKRRKKPSVGTRSVSRRGNQQK